MRGGRLGAVLVGALAALVPAVTLLPAAPAVAQGPAGSLFLDGLYAEMPVGAGVTFAASVTNDGPGAVVGLRTLISVSMPGIAPRDVRLDRRELDGSWLMVGSKVGADGAVRFVDDSTTDSWMMAGSVLAGRYRLTFLSRAPVGEAVVSGETQHRVGSEWLLLARSPQYVTTVTASPSDGRDVNDPSMPFTPAPTLGVPAPPIALKAPDVAAGPAGEQSTALPALVSSRLGAGVAAVIVVCLLAAASWLLRREVLAGRAG